jgi:hypothetical protein
LQCDAQRLLKKIAAEPLTLNAGIDRQPGEKQPWDWESGKPIQLWQPSNGGSLNAHVTQAEIASQTVFAAALVDRKIRSGEQIPLAVPKRIPLDIFNK